MSRLILVGAVVVGLVGLGGSCTGRRAFGELEPCDQDGECESSYCNPDKECSKPICTDGWANQNETDIDCGGDCPPCPLAQACVVHTDCRSAYCGPSSTCNTTECTDDIRNGDEEGIDCAGSCPLPCGWCQEQTEIPVSQCQASGTGIPSQFLLDGPGIIPVVGCGAFTVTLADGGGTPTLAPSRIGLLLQSTGDGAFYSDHLCTAPSPTTVMDVGTVSLPIYFSDPVAESIEISVKATGLGQTSLPLVVSEISVVPTTTKLAGMATTVAGSCPPFTALLLNAQGTPASTGTAVDLQLTSTGAGEFFDDPACITPIDKITLAAGEAMATFFHRDLLVETVYLAATPLTAGIGPGTHELSIIQASSMPELPPDATGFTATATSISSADLTWVSGGGSTAAYRLLHLAGDTPPADCRTGNANPNITTESFTMENIASGSAHSFRLCTSNSMGQLSAGVLSSATTPQATPPDPTDVIVAVVSETELQITWTSGGGSTDAYRLAYSTTATPSAGCGDETVVQPNDITATSHAVTGLTPGDEVFVRLCSLNANAVPDVSAGITGSAVPPLYAPPDPTDFTAIATSTTTIELAWVSGGGNTATYTVAHVAGDSPPADCQSGDLIPDIAAVSLTMENLNPGSAHAFRLCAANSMGRLSTGVTANATTPQAPPPDPIDLAISVVSETELQISWGSGGGSTSAYRLAHSPTASPSADCTDGTIVQPGAISGTSHVLTGLTPEAEVFMRVCSLNSNPAPDVSAGITASDVPRQPLPPDPVSVSATSPTVNSLELTWASGGGTSIGYRIAWSQGNSPPVDCSTGTIIDETQISGTTVQLEGLTDDTAYAFRICAINGNTVPDESTGTTLATRTKAIVYLSANHTMTFSSATASSYTVTSGVYATIDDTGLGLISRVQTGSRITSATYKAYKDYANGSGTQFTPSNLSRINDGDTGFTTTFSAGIIDSTHRIAVEILTGEPIAGYQIASDILYPNWRLPTSWLLKGYDSTNNWVTVHQGGGSFCCGNDSKTYSFSTANTSGLYSKYLFEFTDYLTNDGLMQLTELALIKALWTYDIAHHYAITTATTRLPLTSPKVTRINSAGAVYTRPLSTDIRWMISFDGGSTWMSKPSNTWVAGDLGTITDFTPITSLNAKLAGLTFTTETTLDFAFAIIGTTARTPELTSVNIGYTYIEP